MKKKSKIWWENNRLVIVKIVAMIFLLGAVTNAHYSYYQLIKWLISGIGIYSAYSAYKTNLKGMTIWIWVFGIIAILFNPIIPFYFKRSTWRFLDMFTLAIFFYSLIKDEDARKD